MMFQNANRPALTALAAFFIATLPNVAAGSSKTVTAPAKPAATTAARPSAATAHPTTTPGRTPTSQPSRTTTPTTGRTSTTTTTRGPSTTSGGGQSRSFKSPNGGEAHFGAHGEVRQAKVNGMTITHGPGGSREVVRERPGGERVVSRAGGRGYVQHGYSVGRDRFEHRSYVYRGARYERFYRPYFYHGVAIDVYLPRYYYGPAFYGWAYAPWAAPIYYNWAFTASPWYAYYGGYFAPYPAYASPSLWLTDYLIAASLQQGYQAQAEAQAQAAAGGPGAPLTPEVKQAIADEIRRQIALENAERQTVSQNAAPDAASSGIERMLSDNAGHVFVVGAALTLNSNAGECAVTEGDVLQLALAQQPSGASASLLVLSSKGPDCARGATVSVAVNDLQDMQNHMRETIDQGLGELKSRQGQAGLPPAPAPALAAPIQGSYATLAPPPDPNAASEVTQQAQESVQAEQELVAQSLSSYQGTAGSAFTAR